MRNLVPLLALSLTALAAPPALAQGLACAERSADEPSYPYKLVTHFSLALSSRQADGKLGPAAFDAAMADLQKANAEVTALRIAEGCAILERLASQYRLSAPRTE